MYIPRLLDHKAANSLKNKKIIFILGPRQVGKTTLMEEFLKDHKGALLNLDIAVDAAKLKAASNLSPTEAMRQLGAREKILVIDEAHRYPEVGRIVKGWYDASVPTKIFLLGSSSLNLLDKAAESLTGRNEKLFLTPLLFEEILTNQSWYMPGAPKSQFKTSFRNQIQSLLLNLIVYGSYPETLTTNTKENYLFNLVSDYLLKDILQTELVKSPESVSRLLLLLAHQIGSEVSVNELASNLNLSRQTVDRYLDLLERTFVIFRLPSFSTNPRKEIAKSKKIYFWDTGVRNALLKELNVTDLRSDIGFLWESWIVAEFSKRNLTLGLGQNLYFWRTRDGSEVDLIIKDKRGLQAFEIKWSAKKKSSRMSFFDRYQVEPKLINRDNFVDYIL